MPWLRANSDTSFGETSVKKVATWTRHVLSSAVAMHLFRAAALMFRLQGALTVDKTISSTPGDFRTTVPEWLAIA
jgi:hypothetical protein